MTTTFVSQTALAKDLRLTDRRVRQLVEERVLPPARDRGYDLELSRTRYRIYSSGTESDWDRTFTEAEDMAKLATELGRKAHADGAVVADVTAASIAIQSSTTMMNFLTACKSKSRTERELFWGIWKREQDAAIGGLIGRMMELIGETHIRMDDGELVEVFPKKSEAVTRRGAAKMRKKVGRAKASSARR
jgi:hypothetical protein